MVGDLLAEQGVLQLEVEHHGHPVQVEPGVEQGRDAAEALDIVRAVEPGAARSATGFEQTGPLVRAQVLHPGADQLGGNRDAEDTHCGVGHHAHERSPFVGQMCLQYSVWVM
jgi:hypothetical protein